MGEKGLLDFVCVRWEERSRLLDVNVLRGAAIGISDHYLVVARVKVKGGWEKVKVRKKVVEVVRAERLEEEENKDDYKRGIREKWREVLRSEVEDVEEEWNKLKIALMEVARSVCGVKKIGNGRRKGSKWWNEDLENMVKRKKDAFNRYLGTREALDWEEYRDRCREVKREVKRAKRRVEEEWARKLAENFKERNKMFWKEVNRMRKGGEERGEGIKGEDGEILQVEKGVGERWKMYFSDLLNEGIEISNGGGIENGGEVVSEDQERNISKEEVEVAVRKVKKGKSAGMDGIYGEMIKEGPRELFDWLGRMFNGCWREGRVPQGGHGYCTGAIH